MVANDNSSACEFQNGLASSRRYDENRLERNRKPLGRRVQHSNGWRGGSEPNLFKHVGLEAREIPAVGEVFSLDFPLYRTSSPPSKKGEDSESALVWFQPEHFQRFPVSFQAVFIVSSRRSQSVLKLTSRTVVIGNHGSIRDSWPIAISGYPRGL